MSLKVLCDENLPRTVVEFLIEEGCKVVSVPRGASDTAVAALAKKERRVLFTFDSDFANILQYPPQSFYGIVRLNVHPPIHSLVLLAVTHILKRFKTPADFRGRLIIAEPAGFRVWEKDSGRK